MRRGQLTRGLLVCFAAVLAPAWGGAQTLNPHEGSPTAVRAGRGFFGNRCATCHGPDARGRMGPDLVSLWATGKSDAEVFATIRSGVPGSVMPSSTAPDDELWAIVTYLKSLGTVPPWNTGGGDASRGAEIFASMCARCHKVAGTGGRVGPDLSRLAATRSRESVVSAIRDPGASVDPAYRSVSVERRDGRGDPVRGIVKNEDSFSIQLMDTNERLQGYLKSVVKVTEETGSLMPAFGPDRISDQDIDHLLAHFVSIAETGSGSRRRGAQ